MKAKTKEVDQKVKASVLSLTDDELIDLIWNLYNAFSIAFPDAGDEVLAKLGYTFDEEDDEWSIESVSLLRARIDKEFNETIAVMIANIGDLNLPGTPRMPVFLPGQDNYEFWEAIADRINARTIATP